MPAAARVLRWFATLLAAASAGCAIVPPAPWEKDRLAAPAMRFDADPAAARYAQHHQASREAASGGLGAGGGGCGCN